MVTNDLGPVYLHIKKVVTIRRAGVTIVQVLIEGVYDNIFFKIFFLKSTIAVVDHISSRDSLSVLLILTVTGSFSC